MNIRVALFRSAVASLHFTIFTVSGAQAQEIADKQAQIRQAEDFNEQAQILFKEGKYAEARPLAERAVAITERTLGADHPELANSLYTLAEINRATGAYDQSISLHKRALAIREKVLGLNHADTATSLDSLGWVYRAIGEYTKATQLLQLGLSTRERVLGKDHQETSRSLLHLGGLYYTIGDYSKAEPLYQRALSIRESTFGPEHTETAAALNNLALLYSEMGDYGRAEPLYRRALAINEKLLGAQHPNIASSLNNLAIVYQSTGAYDKAESLYSRALDIKEKTLGPDHPGTAISLNNLALLYTDIGAYAKAMPLCQRALEINERSLGAEHPDTAFAINILALTYAQTGNYDKAEPMYRNALAILERTQGIGHPDTAAPLNNLAKLEEARGHYTEAERLYRRVLAIREKVFGPEHPETADTLTSIATIRWAQNEPRGALQLMQRAQVIQARNSDIFLLSGSETRMQAYLQARLHDTYRNVSFSAAIPGKKAATLGLTSVLQYKGRVLDAMSNSVARLRKNVNLQDRALIDELARVANQLSTLIYQGPRDLSVDEYRQRLDTLGQRQEKLETDLSAHSYQYRRDLAPISFSTVQNALPNRAVLVEWFRYEAFSPRSATTKAANSPEDSGPRYVAYVVKRHADPIVVDLGDARVIESAVREFRLAVSDPHRSDVKERASALSNLVFKPLAPHISDSSRLLFSPDGALNLVPMNALLDDAGNYLVDRFEISYLTSGRDLLSVETKSNGHERAVVVADPNFGTRATSSTQETAIAKAQRSGELDRGGMIFRSLANTSLEAQELKSLLNLRSENMLLRDEANESNVRQLHGPQILHIASHGFFLSDQEFSKELDKDIAKTLGVTIRENPLLRSGIALTGANARRSGERDDGILTALEVAQLDLQGTDLVVLSACDTGIGDIQNGEGVYGLRRALVLAGAQTQVTSLWKVADDATRILMLDYYKRLLNGEGRSAALRHAQLAIFSDPTLAHPYYWASFVPVGNWAPLPPLR